MTHPRELIALITRLHKSGQPLKQVRLLLKLWRAINDVPSRERFRLLRHLGLEGGEQLVAEFLSGGGRLEPEMAATALQLVEGISPARLRGLTSRHLSPEETDSIVEMVRDLLRQQAGPLADKAPPQDVAPPPSEEPWVRTPKPEPEQSPENQFDEVVEIASKIAATFTGAAAVSAMSASGAPAGELQDPEEESTEEESAESAKAPEVAEPEADEGVSETEPQPASEPAEAPPAVSIVVGPTEQPPEAPAPEPPASETSLPWMDQLELIATPTSRLLAFRRLESRLGELSSADARALIELFPRGWMRRRVFQSLFAGGLVEAAEATQILTQLEPTPVTYLWLAGALLNSPDTSAGDRQTLIEQAPSATIRRLLEARIRTSG